MASDMPSLYNQGAQGALVPAEPKETVGEGLDMGRFMNASASGCEQTTSGVLQAIKAWLHQFRGDLTREVERVDNLSLVLDARRRTVAGLEGAVSKLELVFWCLAIWANSQAPLRQLVDVTRSNTDRLLMCFC